VTGDRLARIEERLVCCQEAMDQGGYRRPVAEHWYAEDVLALVNIAKAARPMADLPWPLSFDERQQWIVKQNQLREALAALGEEAAG
jgi:hypothetical protein